MTFAHFIKEIIDAFSYIVIPIIITLTFFVFITGVIKNFFFSTDSTKRQEAHSFMLWGILGMVLLFSVWGLVRLLLVTFGIS